ncbi:MAG: STAS domain-containing protein [Armatimonadetes bacterium]|nr:STAS domain-containing protein [Armatimonadota bacterium]
MSDSVLEIEVVRENPSCPVIRLQGELDASTAPEFKSALQSLLTDGCRDLLIDLERLYLLDSAALGTLVSARQRVPGSLRLQNPSPVVRRVLETTGVSRLLEIREAEGDQQQLLNFRMAFEDADGGIPVVRLCGELDAYSVSHFRGGLIGLTQEGHRFIVLHLGGLEFVDSVGLGGMVSIYTRLRKAGGCLYVAESSEQIAKVLRITGLDALFPLYPTCDEAVTAAAAAAAAASP